MDQELGVRESILIKALEDARLNADGEDDDGALTTKEIAARLGWGKGMTRRMLIRLKEMGKLTVTKRMVMALDDVSRPTAAYKIATGPLGELMEQNGESGVDVNGE